jgi:hypothetical protein
MSPKKESERTRRANLAWGKLVEKVNWLSHVHDHETHDVSEIHEALVEAEEGIRGVRLLVEENLRERGMLRRGKPKFHLVRSQTKKSATDTIKEMAALVRANRDAIVGGLQKNRRLEHKLADQKRRPRRISKSEKRRRYDRAVMHALFEMRQYQEWICACEDCLFIRKDFGRTGDLCPSCGCPASEESPRGCGAHLV